jgi:glycosyltransferase involved in cell wall biosynthesis
MIKRVFFTESSPNVGGQELQLLAQASGLAARGIDTRVLCRPGSRIAEVARTQGLPVVPVAFRNSLHPPSLAAVRSLIARATPDAIVCHSGHDANTIALAARLRFSGRRPALLRARTYQHGLPHAWTYNHLFDRTLVPSEELRHRLLAHDRINPAKIHVLRVGIDFDAIAEQSTQPLPEAIAQALDALPPRRLIHAAMLRPEKGHLLMLEVIAGLQARHPDLGYVIAGEGVMRQAIVERAAALGISHRIALLGMVRQVPALLRRATLVVMPSSYEPLGMSQIEALSLDIPVVGSRVGGIPETIQDGVTGLLAPPDDVSGWIAAVDRALSSPGQMAAMARAGNVDVRARFGMQTNLDQLLAHIRACRHQA